eukprot:TRINITY_DN5035_c0_g1_i1.p1 TRINITY_DN5035_c0_g1~~TRINITY_DN5035_c0_g1_i1.p1  ORF type:complete len:442 (+),score=101.18 TRINITY_DN5035_c0_g1_i1:69-1328(+)
MDRIVDDDTSEFVITHKIVGKGMTGLVKLAYPRASRCPWDELKAVKIIDKRHRDSALDEVALLQALHHPNIIRVDNVEEDEDHIYVFMEHMEAGNLVSYLAANAPSGCCERDARVFFRQMVAALEYCHNRGVCHHDFKLENCVVNGQRELRVIDFGFAQRFSYGRKIEVFPGSPAYAAPEVLFRLPHDETADIYALGVSLYELLTGRFPFCDIGSSSLQELMDNTRAGAFSFPAHVSMEARDLIRKMLQRSPARRIDWPGIRAHAWFKGQAFARPHLSDRAASLSTLSSSAPTPRSPATEALGRPRSRSGGSPSPPLVGRPDRHDLRFLGSAAAATPAPPLVGRPERHDLRCPLGDVGRSASMPSRSQSDDKLYRPDLQQLSDDKLYRPGARAQDDAPMTNSPPKALHPDECMDIAPQA